MWSGLDANQKGPIERGPEVGGVVRAAGPHVVDAVVALRHLEPLGSNVHVIIRESRFGFRDGRVGRGAVPRQDPRDLGGNLIGFVDGSKLG